MIINETMLNMLEVFKNTFGYPWRVDKMPVNPVWQRAASFLQGIPKPPLGIPEVSPNKLPDTQ